jgi:dolichol-phosphate mannosyltransferase
MPLLLILLFQWPFVFVLLSRLSSAPRRIPALQPVTTAETLPVTVVIPTLNEVLRLPTCLAGLQDQPVKEVLVVDSNSQDGTRELVQNLAEDFPVPLRLITDPPLPPDWIGRPWALHHGFLNSSPDSQWILGLDADTLPQPGLVASLIQTAENMHLDMLSLSPRFILKTAGEQWLQPALLVTLVYRFGATGDPQQFQSDRIMANGQCLLIRRQWLETIGGYSLAKSSFCDDVTLVRASAERGAKVAFLDGKHLLQVRMYTSFWETWTEWGRSLDLKDASTPSQTWFDCLLLLAVQGLPLPLVLGLLAFPTEGIFYNWLLGINTSLLLVRWLLPIGIRDSYTEVGLWFWLSPLADPLAVLRIWLSALTRPKRWRGREYT